MEGDSMASDITIYTRQLRDSIGATLEAPDSDRLQGKMIADDIIGGVRYIAVRWQRQGIATYMVDDVHTVRTSHAFRVRQIHFGLRARA